MSETFYQPNPPRGCGTKKKDAFYLESGEVGDRGTMWAATHLLGSGLLEDLDTIRGCNIKVPPRQMNVYNIPGTIANAQLEPVTQGFVPVDVENGELYERLKNVRVKRVGVIDHVGSSHYSPREFSLELSMLGASRRTTPEFAMMVSAFIRRVGPVPVLFTHSRMPVFETEMDRDEALAQMMFDARPENLRATWLNPDFGMFTGMDNGGGSYLHNVLRHIDEGYEFPGVSFCEQPFAASWYTRVSYTLPDDGMVNERIQQMYDRGLINIIDLDEIEKEVS